MRLIQAYWEMFYLMRLKKKVVKVQEYEEELERKSWVQRFFEWLLVCLEKYGQYESFEE